jgi:UPF0148 protein
MSNDSIKQGAYYLLRGGTLLSEPCQKCGNLQIKFKGEIICLSCQEKSKLQDSAIAAEKDSRISPSEKVEGFKLQDSDTRENYKSNIETNIILEEIEGRLIQSIADLSVRLTMDRYSKGHKKTLSALKESLKILEIIKRLKNPK